jgi:arsenate reductase-like glutaredoxin family protein
LINRPPVFTSRCCKLVRDMVKELRVTGTVANLAQRTPSREELNEFIGAEEATQLAEKYRIV